MRTNLERKAVDDPSLLDFACEFKLAGDEKPVGTIEGYASVFNLMDRGGDIVLPGAFKSSLAEWRKQKAMPPMLWQHNPGTPIGVWTDLAEDEKGLKVTGELILEVPLAAATHALLKRKAVGGLSIGYRSRKDEIDRATGARRLQQVELWEVSLVTIPMLREAQISGVKSDMNFNPREMEEALREGGLSRADSKAAVAIFRKTLSRDAKEPEAPLREGARDVLLTLRKATAAMRA